MPRFTYSMRSELLVSIIVPTYNERDNLPELVTRLHTALSSARLDYEVVIVDDNSPDGTAELAQELSRYYPIRVIKRAGKLGLASAVVEGFRHARGEILVVMDADLQHPPELVPELVRRVQEGYDIAIASRYVKGGRIENWSLVRRIISKGAILLAHLLLPRTRGIKDPVSGFFAVKREVIEGVDLNPLGYKILIEILVKGKWTRAIEIPYTFRPRARGKSKLSLGEIVNYAKHVLRLAGIRS